MEVRRIRNDELQHMGTIGMKWGVRRYQNKDGSLTAAGRAHYGYGAPRAASVGTTTVVRKTKNANVTGDYASNSVGLQGYGQARSSTAGGNTKVKPKSTSNPSEQVYLTNEGLKKAKDIWSYDQQVTKSHDWYGNDIGDYGEAKAALGQKNTKALNDGFVRTGNNYIGFKIVNGLGDEKIDKLRELEITAIGADYCGFVNNNRHSTSKLAAREAQKPNSAVLGNAVSPYIAEKAPNKANQLRKQIEDTVEYKKSDSYKKRHR